MPRGAWLQVVASRTEKGLDGALVECATRGGNRKPNNSLEILKYIGGNTCESGLADSFVVDDQ